MKKIIIYAAILSVFMILAFFGGCANATDFMLDKDKQPRLEVFSYSSAGGLLSSPIIDYCVFTLDDEGNLVLCDKPRGLIRFDIYVESYDVSQRFDVGIIFPDDDILYDDHYDPGYYPTIVKWPQASQKMPIAWETVPKTYTSDGGRGPGGYFTLTVAFWAPMGGQLGWAQQYDTSFFIWDKDNPAFVQPEIVFVVTDGDGRTAVTSVKPWVNVLEICVPCP